MDLLMVSIVWEQTEQHEAALVLFQRGNSHLQNKIPYCFGADIHYWPCCYLSGQLRDKRQHFPHIVNLLQ